MVPVLLVVDDSVVVVPVTGFVLVVVVVVWAMAALKPSPQTAAKIFSNVVCFMFFLCFG
jgi:hypothetical protein